MSKSPRSRTRKGPRRKAARSSAARSRKADALQMLKDDHRRVEALFERFERARSGQKEGLANTICEELKVHAKLEEEIFYPAVRDAIPDEDLMNEAEVEHASAKDLIRQIEAASPSDRNFDALVKVLGEYIKHHVKEEEGEMFKQVRRADLDLGALGTEMQERKRALTGKEPKGGLGGLFAAATGR
jgi:hemerythrin superfamily protein